MIIFDKLQKKYNPLQLVMLELFTAFVLGVLIAAVTQQSYLANTEYIDAMLFTDFSRLDKLQLLIFVLQKRLRGFLIIWLFSITVLAVPYNIFIVAWKGFSAGFVITSLSVIYGWKGFLESLVLVMPQYIIYVPVFVEIVYLSYKIHNNSESALDKKKSRYPLGQLPACLFLLGALIVGCILETFLNPIILDWVMHTFHIS